MDHLPKTIQIFLPDGNARSIRIAEITSRTVHAIQVPRNKIKEAGSRDEVKNVGVYLLFGESEEGTRPIAYIGEAEDCYHRIKRHNRKKDFWNTAVIVTSKTNSFTKAHAKYLEWYCITKAREINRYTLENSTDPKKPKIPEPIEADLIDNIETIKILLSTLGFPILESIIVSKKKKDLFFCKGKGATGQGEYLEDGFVVFEGSTAAVEFTKSANSSIRNSRKKLINESILKLEDKYYVFNKSHIFNTPSAASDIILARSTNGWTSWKNDNGETLDEVYRN